MNSGQFVLQGRRFVPSALLDSTPVKSHIVLSWAAPKTNYAERVVEAAWIVAGGAARDRHLLFELADWGSEVEV